MRKNYEASAAKGKLTEEQVSQSHGPADAVARFFRACRRGPHHRGGVREHGREEGGVRAPRQDRETGCDPRLQHVIPEPQRDRGQHLAAGRRRRNALLLAGERDEAARGRARREDRARRAADRDAAWQEDPESPGCRRRVPRLHRQPHADAAADRSDQAPARGRHARAGRPRPRRVRNADGAVPDGRPRRSRHRLAPRPEPDREHPRCAVRDRSLGPEERRGLLRL